MRTAFIRICCRVQRFPRLIVASLGRAAASRPLRMGARCFHPIASRSCLLCLPAHPPRPNPSTNERTACSPTASSDIPTFADADWHEWRQLPVRSSVFFVPLSAGQRGKLDCRVALPKRGQNFKRSPFLIPFPRSMHHYRSPQCAFPHRTHSISI